jgi:dihydroorotate dehydrogenase (subfamily 1) family protein
MVDLSVSLCGLKLDNPVIPASGTFGFGEEFKDIYDINILGSFVFKGTTLEPRYGNELPRIAECPGGMLNSVGLQNPGLGDVIDVELKKLRQYFNKPVIANISGFSLEEYTECCAAMDNQDQVGIIEVNISCPNVRHGGMTFGTDPASAAEITREAKKVTSKPVIIKLSPNVTDITAIALACEQAGADGLSLINTLLGMRIDIKTRRPVLANVYGGLSGPAVFPVALRMVHQVSQAVSIPVVGIGGVSTARDVVEMMLAGATAVEVGSANLVDPMCCKNIIDELPGVMRELGITRLSEITGGVKV